MKTKEKRKCPVCGEPMPNRNKYACSKRCAGILRRNQKKCIVCGKKFYAPPSSIKKCCSPQCSTIHRRMLHATEVYAGSTQHMRECAKAYPKCVKGPEHHSAKDWTLQAPDGTVYQCHNLLDFFRTHPDLIDCDPKTAWSGIQVIKRSILGTRKKHPCYQWRGWRLLDFS